MVFSSLLFVFAFLALHLIIYFMCPEKHRNTVLIVFSLIFYGWSGPLYLLLLLIIVGISWVCALEIERDKTRGGNGKRWLIIDCVLQLLILGIFKYTRFFAYNFKLVFGVPEIIPEIVLPLGISFYTFQLMSYVIDVYRGDAKAQPKYSKLLLYAGLFHQCVAGPIVRYQTIADEIDNRRVNNADLAYGCRRFAIGLAKKAILANGCAEAARQLLPETLEKLGGASTTGLWLGMLFYTLQIYLDFSAYSDMAIGMGRICGFHYLENFNYPYTADTVQGFWRRWHISLSSFFRDYVYIPLGGSRVKESRWVWNMFVVWFLTGMWHGASWNYIFWGLYFFAFLLLEKYIHKEKWPKAIRWFTTFVIVLVGWVLFRFEDTGLMLGVLKGMFGLQGIAFGAYSVQTTFLNYLFFLIVALVASTPLLKNLRAKVYANAEKTGKAPRLMMIADTVIPALLVILSLCALVGDSYNPFLYFQF